MSRPALAAALGSLALSLSSARGAAACQVCFGHTDSPWAGAMNSGIFVLLGVTAVVLSWFIAVILTIRSRTKRWEARRSALKVVDFARPDRPGQEA